MRHLYRPLVIAGWLSVSACAFAQPSTPTPPPPKHRPAAQADASAIASVTAASITGRLQRWLVNPNGDVDGFLLADGQTQTQVAFPPHLSDALLQAARPGDTVQVSGRRASDAPVLRATSVTSTTTGRSVVDTPREPGTRAPRASREPGVLTAMSASGRVARVLYTGRGDANGVLLEDGSIVRFAPHQGARLLSDLQIGKTVHARGWGSRNEKGNALEATAIGPTVDGMQELFAKPEKGHKPHGGPRGGAKGEHGSPQPQRPGDAAPSAPTPPAV